MREKQKRRWYQFSLRALLIGVAAVCAVFAWGIQVGGRRHQIICRLQKEGAGLAFRHQFDDSGTYLPSAKPPGMSVLKLVFGEFYAAQVRSIELARPKAFTDAEAREVAHLSELNWLAISNSEITDRGLEHLAKLRNLGRLDIEGCHVSKGAVQRLGETLPATRIFSDYE